MKCKRGWRKGNERKERCGGNKSGVWEEQKDMKIRGKRGTGGERERVMGNLFFFFFFFFLVPVCVLSTLDRSKIQNPRLAFNQPSSPRISLLSLFKLQRALLSCALDTKEEASRKRWSKTQQKPRTDSDVRHSPLS